MTPEVRSLGTVVSPELDPLDDDVDKEAAVEGDVRTGEVALLRGEAEDKTDWKEGEKDGEAVGEEEEERGNGR